MEKAKCLVGVYDDDQKLLHAVEEVQKRGIRIADVFTPFPVHGLDPLLGLKESRIPTGGFWFGFLGTLSALTMMVWMNVFDWPMDIGGKPTFAYPSFVPITFELTVLFSAIGMVSVYLIINKLVPGKQPDLADIRQTDDRFVILVRSGGNDANVLQAFNDTGAVDVRETEMNVKEHINE